MSNNHGRRACRPCGTRAPPAARPGSHPKRIHDRNTTRTSSHRTSSHKNFEPWNIGSMAMRGSKRGSLSSRHSSRSCETMPGSSGGSPGKTPVMSRLGLSSEPLAHIHGRSPMKGSRLSGIAEARIERDIGVEGGFVWRRHSARPAPWPGSARARRSRPDPCLAGPADGDILDPEMVGCGHVRAARPCPGRSTGCRIVLPDRQLICGRHGQRSRPMTGTHFA